MHLPIYLPTYLSIIRGKNTIYFAACGQLINISSLQYFWLLYSRICLGLSVLFPWSVSWFFYANITLFLIIGSYNRINLLVPVFNSSFSWFWTTPHCLFFKMYFWIIFSPKLHKKFHWDFIWELHFEDTNWFGKNWQHYNI